MYFSYFLDQWQSQCHLSGVVSLTLAFRLQLFVMTYFLMARASMALVSHRHPPFLEHPKSCVLWEKADDDDPYFNYPIAASTWFSYLPALVPQPLTVVLNSLVTRVDEITAFWTLQKFASFFKELRMMCISRKPLMVRTKLRDIT